MTRTIDFDQFRAEQKDEPLDFIIGGKHYALPSNLPASLAVDIIRMRAQLGEDDEVPVDVMESFGRNLFGETIWEALLQEHRITITEIPVLIERVMEAYTEAPKDEGSETKSPTSATTKSGSRSSSTGRTSKRTS